MQQRSVLVAIVLASLVPLASSSRRSDRDGRPAATPSAGVSEDTHSSGCSAGVTIYCDALPNSTGLVGQIQVSGSLSVAANDTSLGATDLPAGRFGLFVYSSQRISLPFGDGVLCASPFSPAGLFMVSLPMLTDAAGQVLAPLDFRSLPAGGGISGGETWFFQFLHRDVVGTGVNLTTAAEVVFCP